jgi:hypothetical protein
MVAMIGLENLVVNQSVRLEGIPEAGQGPMHDESMQGPFEEGSDAEGDDKSD